MKNDRLPFPRAVECVEYVMIICLISICRCSFQVAGASQVGNPASVVGCVRNTQQKPAAGAKVFLLTSQYVPAIQAEDTAAGKDDLTGTMIIGADTTQFMTVTDGNGGFVIIGVPLNTYNLFVSDSSVSEVAMRRNVVIDRSTVDIGTETLTKPGTLLFNIADTMYSVNGYLAVLGTPLCRSVSSPGEYSLVVPDDTISVVYTTGAVQRTMVLNSYVSPGDTIDITGIPAVVINGALGYLDNGKVSPLSPADTIRPADSTVRFIVSGAYTNKNAALEYQFFISSDSTPAFMTDWSSSNSYLFLVRKSGWCYVSFRVRSQTANGPIVSEWGPTFAVMISRTGLGDSVSVPRAPSLVDSAGGPDTLMIRLLTGGAVSTAGDPVQYRFRWVCDTMGPYMTSWSSDSVATILITKNAFRYYVISQARSSVDTTLFSNWSDTTSIGPFFQ